jgi:hypothetical protein
VVRVCSSRRHNKSQRSAIRVESREPAIDVYNTTGDCFISLRAVVRDKAEVVRAHRFPMHTRPFCFNRAGAGAGGQGAEGRQPPPPPATSLPYPPPRNRSPTQAFTLLSRRALFPQIHTHIHTHTHTHTHTHILSQTPTFRFPPDFIACRTFRSLALESFFLITSHLFPCRITNNIRSLQLNVHANSNWHLLFQHYLHRE